MPAFSLRTHWRDLLAGALLVLLAVGTRLAAWPYQDIVSVDGTNYIRLTWSMFGGPAHASQQPPGFPFLIGLVRMIVGGNGVLAARIVDLFFGLAVLVPLYLLARRFFNRAPSWTVCFLYALTPLAIRYSVTTMSEAPFVFFLVTAALLAHREKDFLAGLLGGAAFLVRPEGMMLVAGLALARGFKIRAWLGLALGFVLLGALPALFFNHHTTGLWTLTRKGVNITSDNFERNEVTPERTVNPTAETPMLGRFEKYRDSIARAYPKRLWAEVLNLARAVGWPFVLAIPLGLFAGPGFAGAGLLQALFIPLFPGVPPMERLVLPLLPFTLLLGVGAARRMGGTEAPWRSWKARGALAVLMTGWLAAAVPAAPTLRLNEDGWFGELVKAGQTLAPIMDEDTLVFCRKPYTAFYAGARYQTTPLGSYHETIKAVMAAGGDYLVVDQVVCEIFRPNLLPLVTDSATMFNEPRLELVYFDPTWLDRHVAIYRILKPGGPGPTGEGADIERLIRSRIPHDPARHRLHAELCGLAHRYEDAIAEYELAIEQDPADVWNLKTLAYVLLELGRSPGRALELAERADRLKPGDKDIEALVARARAVQ